MEKNVFYKIQSAGAKIVLIDNRQPLPIVFNPNSLISNCLC